LSFFFSFSFFLIVALHIEDNNHDHVELDIDADNVEVLEKKLDDLLHSKLERISNFIFFCLLRVQ